MSDSYCEQLRRLLREVHQQLDAVREPETVEVSPQAYADLLRAPPYELYEVISAIRRHLAKKGYTDIYEDAADVRAFPRILFGKRGSRSTLTGCSPSSESTP